VASHQDCASSAGIYLDIKLLCVELDLYLIQAPKRRHASVTRMSKRPNKHRPHRRAAHRWDVFSAFEDEDYIDPELLSAESAGQPRLRFDAQGWHEVEPVRADEAEFERRRGRRTYPRPARGKSRFTDDDDC